MRNSIFVLTMAGCMSVSIYAYSQCPTTPPATEPYGTDAWIGYVYDGADNYTSNYFGTMNETRDFDHNYCDACDFFTNTGCAVNADTYSIRFRMKHNYGCGTQRFTIGGDDGVRLFVDGVKVIDIYYNHSYLTASADVFLTNTIHDFVIEFYEATGQSRVTFMSTYINDATGGTIGNSQKICQASAIDPAAFTNVTSAVYCSGATPQYQWQQSANGSTGWTDVASATSATYDIPSGFPASTTRYYRRRATDGTTPYYSNNVSVISQTPLGNQTTAGTNAWRGYVYQGGSTNFTTNYLGYITETQTFDESFCGDQCTQTINGCDLYTDNFTVRFKMAFTPSSSAGYMFTVGGDDGYRLSIDGGSTWLVNNYNAHGYVTTTSSSVNMYSSNTYNLVLEYFEATGGNRVSFAFTTGTLPVTWSYLDGYAEGNQNVIEWHTASEVNNQGFDVQRALDGKNFLSIGWVEGNGSTLEPHEYFFTDSMPSAGVNYYRLYQIDYDGKKDYSKVIPVAGLARVSIYPNPAETYIIIAGLNLHVSVVVTVTNVITHTTYRLKQDAVQPSRFFVDGLPAGVYTCSVTNDEKTFVEKMVIKE